jgi:hypothetical protein
VSMMTDLLFARKNLSRDLNKRRQCRRRTFVG